PDVRHCSARVVLMSSNGPDSNLFLFWADATVGAQIRASSLKSVESGRSGTNRPHHLPAKFSFNLN
ncbi:MAG: hypothetical protein M3N39_10910, partial [Pseudomonadota bacterium]|nr:hypothetical protein [Pseudomonadota bacterium]